MSSVLLLHAVRETETLHLLPLLTALSRRSQAPVSVLSDDPLAPLLLADQAQVLPLLQRAGPMWRLSAGNRMRLRQLRRLQPQLAIALPGSARLTRLAPLPPTPMPSLPPDEHRCLSLLRLVNLPVAADWLPPAAQDLDPYPRLPPPEVSSSTSSRLILPILEGRRMAWPSERWQQLLPLLRARGYQLELWPRYQRGRVPAWLHAETDIRCQTRLPDAEQLRQRLATAAAVIGCDSPWLHLAAAYDSPVVAIAGTRDPRLHRPMAPPRHCRVLTPLPLSQVPSGEEAWRSHCRSAGVSPSMVLAALEEVIRTG